MDRRKFLTAALAFVPSVSLAHSPWGQFQVYRQKHLLILSSRDGGESYSYSKLLAIALNREQPSAKARPARAENLARLYDLMRTKQFTFALLEDSQFQEIKQLDAKNEHSKYRWDVKSIYSFKDMRLVVQSDFDEQLVRIVTYAVAESSVWLPDAHSAKKVMELSDLHPAAMEALQLFIKS